MLQEMMEKRKGLLETFDAKTTEQKGLLDKGPEITQEDVLKAQALNTELDGLHEQIKSLDTARDLQTKNEGRLTLLNTPTGRHTPGMVAGRPGGMPVGFSKSEDAVLVESNRKGGLHVTALQEQLFDEKAWKAIKQDGYREAFHNYLRKGWHGLANVEQKLLQEGADPSGGYLAPEDMLNEIVMRKPTPVRVRGYVRSMNTTRDAVVFPKVNYSASDNNLYTTGIKVTWTGEVPATATQSRVTDPVFGQIRIPIYTAMMSEPITNDLLEDSAVALQPWLEERYAETIELLDDNMILNGTGVGQPTGILANPGGTNQPAVIHSGSASALTADGLVTLAGSLPEQYDDEARFVMSKTSGWMNVRKLKDGDGRYLAGMGTGDSGLRSVGFKNPELLDYPVNYSGFMPAIAAGAYPILFGDLRGYYFVRRVGVSIQVLRELYAETNQVLLLARYRIGGEVAEDWRMLAQLVAA